MRWPPPPDWPMAARSRQVLCRPHRWHVQEQGTGPTVLLLHGAGGASQSFRGLFPQLAATHHVVAIDLPGQGFTQMGARQRCGLAPMAEDIAALCVQEGWAPDVIVGHSAGGALALQMALTGMGARIVGINAALGTFKGVSGWLFPAMARVLAMTPFTADLFTARITPDTVRRMIEGTGSTLTPEGLEIYRTLATDAGHVDATLAMMAQWKLEGLLDRLPAISNEVRLIVGARDKTVPPETSQTAARALPRATVVTLDGLGHLAHEEDPARVVAAMGLSDQ